MTQTARGSLIEEKRGEGAGGGAVGHREKNRHTYIRISMNITSLKYVAIQLTIDYHPQQLYHETYLPCLLSILVDTLKGKLQKMYPRTYIHTYVLYIRCNIHHPGTTQSYVCMYTKS